jgi:hypothetical protein
VICALPIPHVLLAVLLAQALQIGFDLAKPDARLDASAEIAENATTKGRSTCDSCRCNRRPVSHFRATLARRPDGRGSSRKRSGERS